MQYEVGTEKLRKETSHKKLEDTNERKKERMNE